jgi:hypothetical protein
LGCQQLTALTVAAQNPSYSSADGVLFDVSGTVLVQYPEAKTGTGYTIPPSVTDIRTFALVIA